MLKRFALLLAALIAVTALATPAEAATNTRPVTVTATSACVQYSWTVTATVTSTRARVVDVYASSDYGNDPVQLGIALAAGVPYVVTFRPGSSAQYAEIGVFPAGSGGWDGEADPLAWTRVRDPIQSNPYATC